MEQQPHVLPEKSTTLIPRHFLFDYSLGMLIFFLGSSTLIAKLTDYYNLPIGISNFITTLPPLLTMLEFFSDSFYKHVRITAILFRFFMPLTLFTVFLPRPWNWILMSVAFFIMCSTYHLHLPSYNTWMVNGTLGLIRSNYFLIRDLLFIPLFTFFSFVIGLYISHAEKEGQLQGAFATIGWGLFAFAFVSLYFLCGTLPSPAHPSNTKKASLFAQTKLVLLDKEYRKVLTFYLVWIFFFQFASFVPIYYVRVLEKDYFTITLYSTISNVLRTILIALFSIYATKIGWKNIIYLSFAIMLAGTICLACITPENEGLLFPVASILKEIPWAGLGTGFFYYQIAYTTPENRSAYFSVHAGLSGILATIGVLCSNALVSFLSMQENPSYILVFGLWIFGIVAAWFLVSRTPYPRAEPAPCDATRTSTLCEPDHVE